MRIERKTTVNLGTTTITVGELKEILDEFGSEVRMHIQFYAGSGQRESSYATLIFDLTPPKGH